MPQTTNKIKSPQDRNQLNSYEAGLLPRAERPKRRVFTNEYRLAIVAGYDALTEPGARGALLRREGLYHSHLIEWRRARDGGALSGVGAAAGTPAAEESGAGRAGAATPRQRADGRGTGAYQGRA